MQQFREVSRTRTIYSTETHTSDFILNTFWNGKLVQFFQERCCVVMTGCQENKSCSKVLNFLERLDDRIRCTHKETVAYIHSTPSLRSFPSVAFETVPMFIWLTMALSRPRYKQCCQTGKNLMSIPKRKSLWGHHCQGMWITAVTMYTLWLKRQDDRLTVKEWISWMQRWFQLWTFEKNKVQCVFQLS